MRQKTKAITLMVLGIIIGTVLITPASAHIGTSPYHLWSQHIKPWALSLFYTKSQSNSRYYAKWQSNSRYYTTSAANNRYYTKAQADARYATNSEQSDFSKKYAQVVVVAKSGGDFTSPTTAMASITDNSPTTPYLLQIAPGVYDLGKDSLRMKQYVDVEGSGENATLIRSQAGGHTILPLTSAAVVLADNTRLSRLTAENNGSNLFQAAILASEVGENSATREVTAKASGGNRNIGLFVWGHRPEFTEVKVMVEGSANINYGVYSLASSLLFSDSSIEVTGATTSSYGLYATMAGTVEVVNSRISTTGSADSKAVSIEFQTNADIKDSVLSGATHDLRISSSAYTTKVAFSKFSLGGISNVGATLLCRGNYDSSGPMPCQ